MQVNDYTMKIEIETVQCSFRRFRPSGEGVLKTKTPKPTFKIPHRMTLKFID